MMHGVQQSEQRSPGIPDEREPLDAPRHPERLKVGDMLAPSDGHVTGDRRAPAAALVVVDQGPALGERIESGKEIVVMGTGAAVENDGFGSGAGAALEDLDAADGGHRRTASPSATFLTSASSSGVNGSGSSLSTSIWPRIVSPRRISTTSSERVQVLQAM